MSDFLSAIVVSISILALIAAIWAARKLLVSAPPPVKSPSKSKAEEPQIEEEHIAAIQAVLTHHLGARSESLRVTRITPL